MGYWLAVAILALASCTPWRVEYLEEATGHATQDEVAKRLGPPLSERTLTNGEAVWYYRYMGADYTIDTGSTWCREYILTFDEKKVLRNWVRQKC